MENQKLKNGKIVTFEHQIWKAENSKIWKIENCKIEIKSWKVENLKIKKL